jgi:hypothetical protein
MVLAPRFTVTPAPRPPIDGLEWLLGMELLLQFDPQLARDTTDRGLKPQVRGTEQLWGNLVGGYIDRVEFGV